MSIRDQAIGHVLEKIQELAAEAKRLHAEHKAALTSEWSRADFQTYSDHRDAIELQWAIADRWDLLAEAITAWPLFDEIDAEFPKAAPGAGEAEDSDETPVATCIRCNKPFAESDDYHQVAMSGPNSLLFIHSEDCEASK